MEDRINSECEDGNNSPEGVTSCDECEHNVRHERSSMIGAQIGNAGWFRYCELGYWKEEI